MKDFTYSTEVFSDSVRIDFSRAAKVYEFTLEELEEFAEAIGEALDSAYDLATDDDEEEEEEEDDDAEEEDDEEDQDDEE